MFLKNRNISSKIKRSKVTDYAALIPNLIACLMLHTVAPQLITPEAVVLVLLYGIPVGGLFNIISDQPML